MALERLTTRSLVPPWVVREHEGRYAFAAGLVAGKEVIDCACGEGAGSKVLVAAGAEQVMAVDVDALTVAGIGRHPRLRPICADGPALPLRSGCADAFVALETIEHIDDARAFLAEARRCLRPGGLFILSTPNRLVTNPGTSITDRPFNPHHVREYSPRELQEELAVHFPRITLYGQVPQGARMSRVFDTIASRLTPRIAARVRQLSKLPRFLRDRPQRYEVREGAAEAHEYLVAVCSAPAEE